MNNPAKILVVDDRLDNLTATRRVLELAGYRVFTGENAAQALELARAQRPDLMLVDVNLGDESGLDICRQIKSDAELGATYVVIMSATATASESQAVGLEQGADGYIARPIGNRELVARVAALLRIKDTEDALRASEAQTRALLAQTQQSRRALLSALEDQKRAEEQLRESESRFRRLAENAPDLIYRYEFSPKRGFTYVSPAAQAVTGYAPEEHYADPELGTKIVHPDDLPLLEKYFQNQGAFGEPLALRWIRKDGSICWTEQRNVPITNEAGELIAIEGIARDITARKQAELELRQRTDDLALIAALNDSANRGEDIESITEEFARLARAAFDSRDAAVYLLTPDEQQIVMPSFSLPPAIREGIEKLIGHPIPKVQIQLGKDSYFRKILDSESGVITSDPQTFQRWMAEFAETTFLPGALRGVARKLIPQIYKLLDVGSTVSIPLVSSGRAIGILDVSSGRQFTEEDLRRLRPIAQQMTAILLRKRAEQGLKESEERFASAFNSSPIGIVISALDDGRMIDVNPGFLRIFGYEREELIGRSSLELGLWANPAMRDEVVQSLRREGRAYDIETQARKKSGEIRDALASFELIWLGGERCMISVVHDVTEVRRAQQEARLLQTIALGVGGAKDLDETIQNILRLVCEATGWIVGEAWVPSADGARLEIHPAWHSSEPGMEKFHAASAGFTFELGVGLPGRAWQSRRAVWIEDVTRDPNFPRAELARQAGLKTGMGVPVLGTEEARQAGLHAGVSIPVMANGQVTLVLDFFMREARPQDPRLIELISAIAAELGIVIERKRAQEEMRKAEEKYRALVEESPNVLYLDKADEDSACVYISPQIKTLLGYTPADFEKEPLLWHKIIDPRDYEIAARSIRETLKQGKAESEYRMIARDGRAMWVHDTSVATNDAGGKPQFIRGFLVDITERKEAEEALRKLSRAVEQTADMVFITDPNGVIEYVNPAFEQLTGYALEEARGNTPRILKSGLQDEAYYAKLWQTIKAGEVFRMENVNRKKNGELYTVEQTITPIRDEGGNVTHFVSNCKDITARKQAEEAMRRRVTELEAVARISASLRIAQNLNQMLPLLLDDTLAALDAEAGAIRLYNAEQGGLYSAASRGWFENLREVVIRPGDGIVGRVFSTGETHVTHEFYSDPQTLAASVPQIPAGWGGVCFPLRAANEIVGTMFVSVQLPREISPDDIRLLASLSEMGGTAIHRLRLHEETKKRLEQLQALQAIDRAIAGSLDLRLILDILLKQAQLRLGVDAAAVLLADPYKLRLQFAAGQGFRSGGIELSSVRMGDGHAGRAFVERRVVQIPNLSDNTEKFIRGKLLEGEDFVFYAAAPLLAKGQAKGVMEVFRRAPLAPDADWLEFMTTFAGQAAIAVDNIELFTGLDRSNFELSQAYDATIEGWSRAMDLRDRETEGHTRRVTDLTLKLARAAGLSDVEITHIRRGALLHDIGKMGIPDSILLKPGRLTDEEWELMRKHPQFAYDMLSPIDYLKPALDIPWSHHEKWDGTGYPRGLKGEQIPLAARLFSFADVYDAVTSNRPYRAAWTKEQALAYIREQSGRQFDPELVPVFMSVAENSDGAAMRK